MCTGKASPLVRLDSRPVCSSTLIRSDENCLKNPTKSYPLRVANPSHSNNNSMPVISPLTSGFLEPNPTEETCGKPRLQKAFTPMNLQGGEFMKIPASLTEPIEHGGFDDLGCVEIFIENVATPLDKLHNLMAEESNSN